MESWRAASGGDAARGRSCPFDARPGELAVAGGVPADEGEVGGVAVLRIGDAISCIAEAPLDVTRAYPVHAAAVFSGDGVVIFGGGVPCLSFAPVFGDSVRVVT